MKAYVKTNNGEFVYRSRSMNGFILATCCKSSDRLEDILWKGVRTMRFLGFALKSMYPEEDGN
jgi:hypothetical protein